MSKKPSVQVDLVIYKGGERLVIGKAAIDPDGSIQAQIAKDLRADVKDILGKHIGDISINPPVQAISYDLISSKIQEINDGQA